MMGTYKPFNKEKRNHKGTIRTVLATLAVLYLGGSVIPKSIELNKSLKPLEDKFEEFINKQCPSEKREWNEEYGENVTTLTFKKGVIKPFLDERDAYLKFNKGTENIGWHIKQDKVGEPYYVRKSGTSVVFNPFAKHKTYDEFKKEYQNSKLETIVEDK